MCVKNPHNPDSACLVSTVDHKQQNSTEKDKDFQRETSNSYFVTHPVRMVILSDYVVSRLAHAGGSDL
jgi:hypothetical protein